MSEAEPDDSTPMLVIRRSKFLSRIEVFFVPAALFAVPAFYAREELQLRGTEEVLLFGAWCAAVAAAGFFRWPEHRNPAVVFACHAGGIRSADQRFIRWEDMDYIDSNPILGSMTFHLHRGDTVSVRPLEVGDDETRQAIALVLKVAPKYLTAAL